MDGIKFQKEVEEGKWPHFPKHIKFLDFCLKGSEKFADRKIISERYEKCEENDYDISQLNEFFNYKENEPIVKINPWDKLKNKVKKNNLQLLPAADLDNKKYSQYATSSNPDKVGDLSKNSIKVQQRELAPWDLRKFENDVTEIKQNKQLKTREKEEQER